MSGEGRSGKKRGARATLLEDNPFRLPKTISRRVKQSARHHTLDAPETVKYLWIVAAQDNVGGGIGEDRAGPALSANDWLNVVDEAASLGVQCMAVCVGSAFSNWPEVWHVSSWAQDVHGMTVGFHVRSNGLSYDDRQRLTGLVPGLTWLFVPEEGLANATKLAKHGIRVCNAEVSHDDPQRSCDGLNSIVFVGPNGILYSCGLVLGIDEFSLGHVSEEALSQICDEGKRSRSVPRGSPRNDHGCDGCPNQMARRILGR